MLRQCIARVSFGRCVAEKPPRISAVVAWEQHGWSRKNADSQLNRESAVPLPCSKMRLAHLIVDLRQSYLDRRVVGFSSCAPTKLLTCLLVIARLLESGTQKKVQLIVTRVGL